MRIFLPFYYLFYSRLKSNISRIAWIFTYIISIFIVSYLSNIEFIFTFLLIFSIYFTYEIGYIYNDCEVIKKEINPTLRLKKEDFQYYEKYKLIIYSIRILFLSIIIGIIYLSYPYYINPVFYTLGGISFLYIIHNNIRNHWNILSYSLLIFFRYFAFFSFIEQDIFFCFLLWIVYPLCVTIEFSSKSRFYTSNYIKIPNFDRFRVFYYILLVFISFLLCIIIFNKYTIIFLILSLYFALYRLLSFFLIDKKYRNT